MKSAIVLLCLSPLLSWTPVWADNLTLPQGGRVVIEIVFSEADFSNTMSVRSPQVGMGASGCVVENSGMLSGLLIGSEKPSQRGCRVELDADRNQAGIQPFAAGTTFEFGLCAQTDADGDCENIWSSDPGDNSDGSDHLRITPDPTFPNQVFVLAWEDKPDLGDQDFNDFVAVLRVDADSDGDGLWDDWETNGIDAEGDGTVDLDLPALGADLKRKDLFLEIDFMDCSVQGGDCGSGDSHSHRPRQAAIDAVVAAFANAPVANPDGSTGIDIHIDVSNAIPHANVMNYEGEGGVDFDDLKLQDGNFGPFNPRRFAYRYCIFSHRLSATSSSSGKAEAVAAANDFIVSLGAWTGSIGTAQEQAGTLMHELGHTLGLLHGGNEDTTYKPNYLSVMNYSFQTRGICGGDPVGDLTRPIDYSRMALEELVETELDENTGIGGTVMTEFYCNRSRSMCSGPTQINWNCNNGNMESMRKVNINGDCTLSDGKTGYVGEGQCTASDPDVFSRLDGFDDWPAILLEFQDSVEFQDGAHPLAEDECLDFESANPPIADAGPVPDGDPMTGGEPTSEFYSCNLGDSILLDGSGSLDPNGTIVSHGWNFPAGQAIDEIGELVVLSCETFVGVAQVFLVVEDDSGLRSTDSGTVMVALDLGDNRVVECTSPAGARVTLGDGLPANAALAYQWSDSQGALVGTEAQVEVRVALGSEVFTAFVTDFRGVFTSDSVEVTVQDTTPPSIVGLGVAPGAQMLWPPNDRFTNVELDAAISDLCDVQPSVSVLVYSDESDSGSGLNAGDVESVGLQTLRLRAERDGRGNGRVYLMLVAAADALGNASFDCATVVVPHDLSQASIMRVSKEAAVTEAQCRATGAAPAGYFLLEERAGRR